MGVEVYESAAQPSGKYTAVFERDDETAYFYLLDMEIAEEGQIVAALPVRSMMTSEPLEKVEIRWAGNRNLVGLFNADRLHAIFDLDVVETSPNRCGRVVSSYADAGWPLQ